MIIFSIPGWAIPVFITIISFCWALFYIKDDGGYFSGITNMIALIPASIISMISWIIYALLK